MWDERPSRSVSPKELPTSYILPKCERDVRDPDSLLATTLCTLRFALCAYFIDLRAAIRNTDFNLAADTLIQMQKESKIEIKIP